MTVYDFPSQRHIFSSIVKPLVSRVRFSLEITINGSASDHATPVLGTLSGF